jgi:exodeoxyribonuclease VII large subunit
VQVTVEYHEVFGLSLSITDIDPTFTLGDLEQRKRAIINQLRDEGVLEMNKELQFPIVPQRIAVISSESAAGYGDFVNQIESNHLGIKFYHQIFPAIMQGEQAPASICSAFDKIFENIEDFDVVIIIRGGGASIDLLCFDDYSIAYYITQFPLPVLTGIGHERDNTIADIVANKSLKTPTAVAEYLISQAAEFLDKIENNSKLLEFLTREKLDKQNHKIELLTQQLSNNVKILLKNKEMSLSIISDKTTNIVKQKLVSYENNLKIKNSQLLFYANTFIKSKEKQIEFLERQNRLNNPVEILKKGYTLTIFNDKIVKQPALLKKGDLIKTKFYDGIIKSIVESIFRLKKILRCYEK